ncbi:MAG: peptidylprolyl isomerase [Candidatus Woesearchaeota archaeon]
MEKKLFNSILTGIVLFTLIVCTIIIVIFLNLNSLNLSSMETQAKELMQDKENTLIIMQTNFGDVYIELYTVKSPITAGNFKELIENRFYDGIKFHRVIPNFMIQGGDPLTKNDSLQPRWGTGGPGYTIEDEFVEGLSNLRGTLSMANSGPQSGGSQFFINTVDNTNLDFDKQPMTSKHPVFGKVLIGMEIIDEISQVPRNQRDVPDEPVIIKSMRIIA